jgi:large subunit ribosomal protein L30
MNSQRIAIIRIRGKAKIKKEIEATLSMLRLYNKNTCVIIPNTPAYLGMLNKIKDYVTWGEITEGMFKDLLTKRGKLPGKKRLTPEYLKEKTKLTPEAFAKEFMTFKKELKDVPGLKQFFKLSPPIKGFERKGIKKPFSMGGSLGYRKEKINELLVRMI